MRSLLTGRLCVFEQSPSGVLHDAQPPASIGIAAEQFGGSGRPLVEPGAFFVDGSYGLRINSWNALAGVVVTIRARILNDKGRLVNQEWMHTPSSNRTKATSDFSLPVGFPLNVTVFASTGAPIIGQTFVQVQIISGFGGNTLPMATLLQDYITSVQALAYPGSPIRSSVQGEGYPRTITGSAPAGGANILELVPTGARWRLSAFLTTFQCSAVVSNRIPMLRFRSPTLELMYSPSNVAQTNGQFGTYIWGENYPVNASPAGSIVRTLPTPQVFELLGGMEISTITSGLDAGDSYSAPQMTVHERLEAA